MAQEQAITIVIKYYRHIDKDEYAAVVENGNTIVVYNFGSEQALGTMVARDELEACLQGFKEMDNAKYCLLGGFVF